MRNRFSKKQITSFRQKVYEAVRRITPGSVMTYASVARVIGIPRAARAVGNALNKNPFYEVPCHRVVRADGRVGGFIRGTRAKIKLLRGEGVKVTNGKIMPQSIVSPQALF